MKKKFVLHDGRQVHVPQWSVFVAVENIAWAGKIIGDDILVDISRNDVHAVKEALTSGKADPEQFLELIKHFVLFARVDGSKIDEDNINKVLPTLGELCDCFAVVCHVQFHDFFSYGIAKAASQ